MNPLHDHQQGDAAADTPTPVISISHFIHTVTAYRAVIMLAMLAVAVAYAIGAIAVYLLGPSQTTTAIPFRLDFEGAANRQYPNGLRFSPADIVSAPVLLKVYQSNHIERFTNFETFGRSVFVLDTNPAYEALAGSYQARLSDPKLGPVDRERIEKEFAMKRDSLAKNEYSINYVRLSRENRLPNILVRKVLAETLAGWADFAVNEQHGLDYRVPIVSPLILNEQLVQTDDYIAQIQVLRAKVFRVIENVGQLRLMPGADLARTADHQSLNEIQFRLEEIVRYRLEPLVGLVRNSGLMVNPALTTRFLENQLAYDQRLLQSRQGEADAVRQSLAVYTEQRGDPTSAGATASQKQPSQSRVGNNETVVPQLSDSFLDRLVNLSTQSSDAVYRQKLVTEYREAVEKTVPLQQAVAYDTQILNEVRNAPVVSRPTAAPAVQAQIGSAVTEVRELIVRMNEIYRLVSRNMNPASQLYTVTGTPITRDERTTSLGRMAIYGLLALLVTLPITILFCLLHNRVREEEAEEGYVEGLRPHSEA
jgi:hypothetical protein